MGVPGLEATKRSFPNPQLTLFIAGVLTAAGLLGITWANHQFAQAAPGGTDFLVHWVGMRAILKGENPYSDATALEIQKMIYGRPALPGEHEQRVVYPLYGEFLFLPFALIPDYPWARALWMTVLEAGAVGFAVLSLVLTRAQWPRYQPIAFILFSVFWYFGARAIINGNAIILISLFLGVAIYAAAENHDAAAGIFLAVATIKPQVALLPIIAVLIWGIRGRRYRMLASFAAVLAALVGVSFAILPVWLMDDLREIARFPSYNPPLTPAASLQAMFGAGGYWAGVLLSVSAVLALLAVWIKIFRAGEETVPFLIGLTIALAPLSGIQTDPGNEFLLLIPLAMVLVGWPAGRISAGRTAAILVLIFVGVWGLFVLTLSRAGQPAQHPIMLFPLPAALLIVIGIDWIRSRRPAG